MKKRYELVMVFDGALSDDTIKKEQETMEEFLKKNAEYVKTDVWGKRNLAYEINKKKIGYYVFFVYDGSDDINEKINKQLKLNTNVVRFMIVLFEEVQQMPAEALKEPIETEEGDE